MKKYDYILVGSGLYAGVFAWYARQKGKSCLVLENGIISVEISAVRMWKVFMCIGMGRIFSIPAIKRYGSL